MQAIGYTRCSTNEQADSGLGLDAQAERITAYCTLKGLDLSEIITDAGVSGGKPLASREGGQRLLAVIRQRKAGAVVMLKLDRMFRNAGDCLTTVERWEKGGVALHVADLGGNAIDTTSAAGRFMLVVLAGAAEMERNLTRERTRSAMAVKRANGQRVGNSVQGHAARPHGLDVPNHGLFRVVRHERRPVVGLIEAVRHGTNPLPIGPFDRHRQPGSLPREVALHLGGACEDHEHKPARCAGRVDGVTAKVNHV